MKPFPSETLNSQFYRSIRSHVTFLSLYSEPEFVNILRSPVIDSQPGGPVRHPYLTFRPDRLFRLVEFIPWNRFLGSINVYKYGLWIQNFIPTSVYTGYPAVGRSSNHRVGHLHLLGSRWVEAQHRNGVGFDSSCCPLWWQIHGYVEKTVPYRYSMYEYE